MKKSTICVLLFSLVLITVAIPVSFAGANGPTASGSFQFDLDDGAQMDAAWVSQSTIVEEAAVAVPEVQCFPSMFA